MFPLTDIPPLFGLAIRSNSYRTALIGLSWSSAALRAFARVAGAAIGPLTIGARTMRGWADNMQAVIAYHSRGIHC